MRPRHTRRWPALRRALNQYVCDLDSGALALAVLWLDEAPHDTARLAELSKLYELVAADLSARAETLYNDVSNGRGYSPPLASFEHGAALLGRIARELYATKDLVLAQKAAPAKHAQASAVRVGAVATASPLVVAVGEAFDPTRHTDADLRAVLAVLAEAPHAVAWASVELSDDGLRAAAVEYLDLASELRAEGAAVTAVSIFARSCARKHPRKAAA